MTSSRSQLNPSVLSITNTRLRRTVLIRTGTFNLYTVGTRTVPVRTGTVWVRYFRQLSEATLRTVLGD